MIPFSVLDLAPIAEGSTAADAFRNSVAYAQAAESLCYERFWLAEHHNMTGIASAATAVVIGHVAGATRSIRVGSGGVMLPNHAPLVIAEQFGTLASLYPGRIDLGLGRAPGTDMATARALRRGLDRSDEFPQDVVELMGYFAPAEPGQRIRAVPGAGLDVPVWLLGSSLFSAQLAAMLGLPFAFASHFAPTDLVDAFAVYRERFRPSPRLAAPYAMAAVNVLVADSDEEARRLFTSQQQTFINLRRGRPGLLPPPIEDIDLYCTPAEKAGMQHMLAYSFVGSSETVERGLAGFLDQLKPDELMITGHVFDSAARVRSLALTAEIRDRLNGGARRAVA
ncbi:LLM class flavin-dependent oxidoreductase [Hansschlegelia beijingensis]|uniref:LLM class flavin-dependent oxidoreductase n=1 Tax=Hansschlegelia beijingensis TaxID=1133344 RepID=UPI00387F363A